MPAESKAQQALFAIAEHAPGKLRNARLRTRMSKISTKVKHEFAATPTRNLPSRISQVK